MNEVLRIGYLTKKFPRFSETFIVNEILGLEEQGVDITVLSRRYPDEGRFHPSVARLRNAARYLSEGRSDALGEALRLHRNHIDDCLENLPDAIRFLYKYNLPQPLGLIAEAVSAIAIARSLNLQHFHAHFATDATTVALLANKLAGIPYSFTAHAKDLYRDGVDPGLFTEKVNHSRFVITVCDANLNHIRERLAPIAKSPVIRLYNGIDLDYFSPCPPPVTVHRIVAVGRLVPKKGFEVLIDAAAHLAKKNIHFEVEILGNGELLQPLQDRAAAAGVSGIVKFLGACTQPEVLDRIRNSSVACLPCVVESDGNRDALPTSLLEAMGCGLPVVSTPVGGVGELVADGETGWLVPAGDSVALAEALYFALKNPTEARKRGAAGRSRAEELFHVRKNTARLKELFSRSARGESI